MINANILGVSEYFDEYLENTDYRILLSISALGEFSDEQFKKIDNILNKLYGQNSESIINLNYFADEAEYLLPYNIDVVIKILELFTYGEGINAYLGE